MSASAHAIPILVIDDDPTSLELAALERPAVVLTDFHFAIAMSGLDATRRLKADPLTAGIPVVALTALAQRQAEQKARDARFDAYLTKPLDATTLRETVRRFVNTTPG